MTLLQPLALVAAAVIPLILLLYMLKRRTRLQPVSSTMLWEKLDQTAAAAININRLLKNLLLLLQLITAALLVLALAYPAASRRAGAGAVSDSIVIVDTSVSMAVQEGEGRRLDRAAELLQEMISGKGAGSRMGIIGMGERATMISGVTADPAALRKAAGSLVINGARANLKEALVLAENMAHALENPQIIIISAGGFEDAGLRLDYPLRYLPVGEKEVENLYLQEMVLDGSRLYLTVANNGTRPARGTVRIRDAEGSAVGQREVSLEPGESRLLTWRQLPASPWYRGEISSPRDQLPGDSEFYLVNSGYWENRLLLVTAGNPFLEQALLLQESLQVSRIKPEQYRPSMGEAYDYFVFDGYLPEELPAAPLLVFDPPHPNPHLQSSPPVLRPELRPLDHPLLLHVDLSEVEIAFGKPLQGGEAFIAGREGTLAQVLLRQGQPLVVFGFPVQAGNLPLQPAFPILIRNIMDYFTGTQLQAKSFRYGEPLLLEPPYPVEELLLITPGGEQIRAAAPFPFRGPLLTETGIYTLQAGDREELVAVNYPSTSESLAAREQISIDGKELAGEASPRQLTPLLAPLLILALLVSGLEWWVDNRGY
ncbi:MAG TPA: BatA domain-containing protein [Bacillota bacterium]|nr:VWA domain-containing protein [Bacillota bacterium]HOB86184.1 BatA domain-containing protein [Bacillota bacterium]HOP68147.1 BatA domain-containing protein [Bacillota bacterium]HPT33017.1 BatA domain-containing protein [Bacillota bacterium]HPZ64124.1 BatA domain-containing protein [Bacillota bacterium]